MPGPGEGLDQGAQFGACGEIEEPALGLAGTEDIDLALRRVMHVLDEFSAGPCDSDSDDNDAAESSNSTAEQRAKASMIPYEYGDQPFGSCRGRGERGVARPDRRGTRQLHRRRRSSPRRKVEDDAAIQRQAIAKSWNQLDLHSIEGGAVEPLDSEAGEREFGNGCRIAAAASPASLEEWRKRGSTTPRAAMMLATLASRATRRGRSSDQSFSSSGWRTPRRPPGRRRRRRRGRRLSSKEPPTNFEATQSSIL